MAATDSDRPFVIKGADGNPLEVPARQYYFNTKARARRMMQNSLSSDARRVYACLELATMGWKQELAVIMDNGKTRPLSPADIRKQTGLVKQNVSRGLAELDDAGVAERRSDDDKPLRNGHILIYSWASPRPERIESEGNRARLPFPAWFPDSWEPIRHFINRQKLSLIDDEVAARAYFEPVADAARAYQEAEEGLARALEPVCARPKRESASLYTKKVKILRERTSSSAVSDVQEAKLEPPVKAEEEESLYQKFKTNYPEGHFDEAKAKESFEKKLRAQQEHILERLQIYVACERWLDDGGRWIPLASTWLRSCFADPPPVLKKPQNGHRQASADGGARHTEMSKAFRENAKEINDALLNGRQLSKFHQEIMDYLDGKT